jgi:hypothetical protein
MRARKDPAYGPVLLGLDLYKRWEMIKSLNLCGTCFKHSRELECFSSESTREITCKVEKCKQSHFTILHPSPVLKAPAQKNFVGFRWVRPTATPDGLSRKPAGQGDAGKVNPMGIKRQKSLKKKAPATKKNTFRAHVHGCPSGQKQKEEMSVRKPSERKSRLDSGGRSATPGID